MNFNQVLWASFEVNLKFSTSPHLPNVSQGSLIPLQISCLLRGKHVTKHNEQNQRSFPRGMQWRKKNGFNSSLSYQVIYEFREPSLSKWGQMQNLYAKMSVTLIFIANYILITAFAPASVLNPRLGAFRNWNGLLRNLKRTCLVTKTATSWWLACSSDLGFIRDAQRQKCFSVWPAWWVTFRALWGSSKKAMKY